MKRWIGLMALLLLCGSALAEDVYYVNPAGGTRYHAEPDCPSISTKYHAGMVEVPASMLEEDAYANLIACNMCGVEKNGDAPAAEDIIVTPGTYIVGVDIPQGLYELTSTNSTGMLIVQKWNGATFSSHGPLGDRTEVIHLYNEYRLQVPEGFQGRFIMRMNESELDTGTRQLMITQPGTYWTYTDFNPGLYIVDALERPAEPLRICHKADNRELRSFELVKGAEYVIFLGSSMMVDLPEGCRLRSFCREEKFNSADPVLVEQARYISGLQIPGGKYRINAQPGKEACYSVMTVYDDVRTLRKLEQNESVIIDLNAYDTEIFLELVNCVVTYAIGDNG